MPDSEITEAFAAKVDAFAASLEPEEQALLIELLTAGDDVAGFGARAAWPGLFTLDVGIGHVGGSAGASLKPDGLIAHELTHVLQGRDSEPKG